MSAGITTEAGTLHGRTHQTGFSATRSVLALGVLAAGISLTFAWMGTIGWVSLRLVSLL